MHSLGLHKKLVFFYRPIIYQFFTGYLLVNYQCSQVQVWVWENIPGGYPCHSLDGHGGQLGVRHAILAFRHHC
jgi:hypothetical protein